MRVDVIQAWVDGAEILQLELPAGATVRDALAAAGIKSQRVGIFGKVVKPDTRLADGDRVEIYRPLAMDPKEARRKRASRNSRARR